VISIDNCFVNDNDFKEYIHLSISNFEEDIVICNKKFEEVEIENYDLIISTIEVAENSEDVKSLVFELPKSILLIKFIDNSFSHQEIN